MKPTNTLTMDSDHDRSSSSSFTAPDSRRSDISDISSISFNTDHHHTTTTSSKPHKANQAQWEAIKRLREAASGSIRLDHFRLIRRLGSGDLGNVYLCQLRDNSLGAASGLYAMKVVDREAVAARKKLQRAEMEKEILRVLDHPFLPTLYAEFDASHYSFLVMEFCTGGDLHVSRQRQPGRRFTVSSAKFYAAETILALEYLHMMGIVYRDLKPENILIRDDGHIMLTDFDLSFKCEVIPKLLPQPRPSAAALQTPKTSLCLSPPIHPVLSCFFPASRNITQIIKPKPATLVETEENELEIVVVSGKIGPLFTTEFIAEPIAARSKSFVGTHEYLAPEVISGAGHGGAVDWWTLGIFLYEMIYGKTPFKGEDNEKTIVNIMKQNVYFPTMEDTGEVMVVRDLISKLLVKNPKKRLGGMLGSVEIKRHEFFKGVNWALIRTVKPPVVPRDQRRLEGVRRKNSQLRGKERDENFQIPLHFDCF